MPIDLVTPLFSNNPFKEQGTFTPPAPGVAKPIDVIFEKTESIMAAGIKIQNADTTAIVKTADVGDPVPSGSTLTVRAIVYKIIKGFDDSTGVTTVQLSKN
jgi:hypothetical protein